MIPQKKTKIIATIGPSSERKDMLEKLIKAGVDVARLNFSHGSHEEHGQRIMAIRKLEKKLKRPVAVMADIQGPKIRIGNLPEEGVLLESGQEITIDAGTREYYGKHIPLPSLLFRDGTKDGHMVFLDDGTIHLKIIGKQGGIFTAVVIKGGILFSKKGVNVPSLEITSSLLSPKDKADIQFAVSAGADYIALSFLRSGKDIREAKKFIGKSPVKIIAKIERPEALANLEEIVDEADAVMVARGDLGIETPLWELPVAQKEIVDLVRRKMKPVIVATQMLDSMIRNPIPTRAEVSDVSNAVFDSADAVMLSGESASGRYPLEAVEMMRKVLESTERSRRLLVTPAAPDGRALLFSVASSACVIAKDIGAKAILTGAITGKSARVIASFRPHSFIIAVAKDEKIARQLALVWGIHPMAVNKGKLKSSKDLLGPALALLKKKADLKKGDKIVCQYAERLGQTEGASAITVDIIS